MKVKTSADFLDDLQAKLGVKSDYAVGKALHIAGQRLSHYRLKKGAFDDETCLKVADVLDIDPAYVVACMHRQREKNSEVKKLWERIATLSIGATACLFVFYALPYVVLPNGDVGIFLAGFAMPDAGIMSSVVYYVKCSVLPYWPFAALFIALLMGLPRHNSQKHPTNNAGK